MLAYRAERLPARLVVPVVALLTIAARAGVGIGPLATLAVDAIVLGSLFAQFRLWDDLADRRHDASSHPERALVRAATDRPFRAVACVWWAMNATAVVLGYPGAMPIALLLAITIVTGVAYRTRTRRSPAGAHLLLLKYPAFVAIVAAGRHVERPALAACSAFAVYLGACLYEALHDPAARMARPAPLVVGEVALLILTVVIGVRS